MHYRRALIPGGTYFFTVALAERKSTLLIEQSDGLREAIRVVKLRHPFEIVASCAAGSSACGLAAAPRGCGLSDALVADQGGLLTRHSEG